MTVERRYRARHPIALRVQILYGRRHFYTAQACNLSERGMYLTVFNLTMPPGTLVELQMDCLGREWLVEAVVVHRDGPGIGVMFREPQSALCQGLIQQAGVDDAAEMPPPRPSDRPLLRRS
jgi:hypothetical protein